MSNYLGEDEFVNINLLTILFFFAVLMTGTQEFISDKFYKKWRINQRMKLSPVKEFYDKGFVLIDGLYLCGVIEGYTVLVDCIWYEYLRNSTLRYQVLFNPKKRHYQFLYQKEYHDMSEKLRKNNRYITLNSIARDFHSKAFLNPNHNELYEDICLTIGFIKDKGLKPITYEESKIMIPEMDSYLRSLQNFSY